MEEEEMAVTLLAKRAIAQLLCQHPADPLSLNTCVKNARRDVHFVYYVSR